MRIGNLEIYRVEGHSMFPSYKEGELILVLNSQDIQPSSGAVVIVSRINGQLKKVIKRVIGMPNDIVRIESRDLFINDKLISPGTSRGIANHYEGSWKLNQNEYFVIGDNLIQSTDSRDFGPITSDEILSKVILKIWSNRISRFFKNIFH